MSLLSIKQMKVFTKAMARDINMNIKNHAERNPLEKVLFIDERWTMTDNPNDGLGAPAFDGARLWHLCDTDRERYQSPYDTIKGQCWSCDAKVPEDILTLWTLYNADSMHLWLDADDEHSLAKGIL